MFQKQNCSLESTKQMHRASVCVSAFQSTSSYTFELGFGTLSKSMQFTMFSCAKLSAGTRCEQKELRTEDPSRDRASLRETEQKRCEPRIQYRQRKDLLRAN